MSPKHSFVKLQGDDVEDEDVTSFSKRQRKLQGITFLWMLSALEAVAIGVFAVLLLTRPLSVKECATQLSVYSPLLDDPNLIKYEAFDLPTYFNQPSPYRGPPTPEREALWEELWHQGTINVPFDKLGALNKTLKGKEYKRTPIEAGGGYAAQVEVLHQLHCVGLLRFSAWARSCNSSNAHGFVYEALAQQLYLTDFGFYMEDHCIEVLRLNIMCQGDVTPILIEMDPKAPFGERADFTSYHKCRNFWDIHAWVKDHVAIP
ncbi:Cyclochlorotine biosynthesis protein O [Apiospora marii]|uniref:Cyclochlorotine biosynthesis protein O n=1 Tax=Apiospora marii TaxID=335849 RepID=A0ABR1REV9_9PEZI